MYNKALYDKAYDNFVCFPFRMKIACEKNAHLQPCMEDLRLLQAKI